jgi:hypothetical protein
MALIRGKLSPQNAQRAQKIFVFCVLFVASISIFDEEMMAGG